ncbi:MAG: hypothetical protein OWV35_05305 [Firmicutes bacterium]|nr:hypothetical protein [Bacillota bacterium]
MTPADVGQLLLIGFTGTEAPPALLQALQQGRAGGVVLFGRNIRSPAQLRSLTLSLEQAARAGGQPAPLIAVDQEGGPVRRLRNGFVPLPSPLAMAAAGLAAEASELWELAAREMRQLGITLDLAPVLDVCSGDDRPHPGVRGFGHDPEGVGRWGQRMIDALHRGGVAATAKHFPGLGQAGIDTHLGLPWVHASRSELEHRDLIPFRAAVAGGVDVLLAGHAVYPGLGAGRWPASLAPAVLGDLARRELAFPGVLMTDCLEMGAIRASVGPVAAAEQAVLAGADLVLFSHTPAWQEAAYTTLQRAAARGDLPRRRLASALAHVATLKEAVRNLPVRPAFSAREATRARLLARRIWEAAVAVTGDTSLLPLPRPARLIACVEPAPGPLEEGPGLLAVEALARELKGRLEGLTLLPADPPVPAWPAPAVPVVLVVDSARRHPGQRALAGRALDRGHPLYVIALSRPADLEDLPAGAVGLTAFDPSPEAAAALARVLTGSLTPLGHWPFPLAHRRNP